MSQIIAALKPQRAKRHGSFQAFGSDAFGPRGGRWAALAAVAFLALSAESTALVVVEALSEAYLAVAVFVAGTLLLIQGLEILLKEDVGAVLSRLRRWQVPAAAMLGAFPGCGGAIVIVTQYTRGKVGFGALVATLTATMGDAMFLLLAKEPSTGLLVIGVGVIVGALSGWTIDAIGSRARWTQPMPQPACGASARAEPQGMTKIDKAWLALAMPGLALGLLAAFQADVDALFGPLSGYRPSLWIGLAGALLSLAVWAERGNPEAAAVTKFGEGGGPARLSRVVGDTSFITSWVVFAFLAFELAVHFIAFDLGSLFRAWAPVVPLMAVLVGWLPGCGPQIVVTSLYLSGALPLSAQLGNAISNDGDALFPALALAPRAALMATLASTIPALLVGYGAYILGH